MKETSYASPYCLVIQVHSPIAIGMKFYYHGERNTGGKTENNLNFDLHMQTAKSSKVLDFLLVYGKTILFG
jgi:hypothetical protein